MRKTRTTKGKKKIDPTIIVALITVVGTIVVTLISVFGNTPQDHPALPTSHSTSAIAIPSTPTETLHPLPSMTPTKEPEIIFGPQNGSLDESNSFIFRPNSPNLQIHNFILSVVFVNPSNTDTWSYSIYFRDKIGINNNYLTICNCGTWSLYSTTPEKGLTKLYDGTINNLNLSRGGTNHIRLVIEDLVVSVVINEDSINDDEMILNSDLGHGGFAIAASPRIDYYGLQILSLDDR